jgi:hypothetical protein
MRSNVIRILVAATIAGGCSSDSADKTKAVGARNPANDSGRAVVDGTVRDSLARASAPGQTAVGTSGGTVEPSQSIVRGLYVNRFAAQSSKRMRTLIAIADSTEINALVIDMKDEFGLNYKTANAEFAKNAGTAGVVPRLKELLDTLRAHQILPIARLVVFKDSVTARVHPDWTIRKADGSAWRDKQGLAWVNPYNRELWEYNIGVGEELVKLGFGEIQFDYIRFPEPYKSLPPQVFPNATGTSKPDALAAYLKLAQTRLNALGVRSTADIFGLVTTVRGALEIGQHWEKVSPVTDVLLPMTYPSHYPNGSFGISNPNREPYKTVKIAIDSARVRDEKLGVKTPEHVRPWIQAFGLYGVDYGPAEVTAQKQAIYDAGYDGWIWWHPGSKYEPYLAALEKELVSRKKK